MGYMMHELKAQVHISRSDHACALAAIKKLHGRETCELHDNAHFMWINDSSAFLNAETLDEALQVWRWPIAETDEAGNIVELYFRGEKYGDEDLLFAAIAPFVGHGSEIMMAGEDGIVWRWFFADRTVRKEFGRVVFDHQAVESLRAAPLEWPHQL